MKIIDTSDWHLGQNFYGYDRKADHDEMVCQLIDLAKAENPDALIIAGDVYDAAAPNISVQKDFADYMVRLRTACPQMLIVCISGNHDSASRHEIFQSPWEALGVKAVGKANKENLEENIIEVPGKGWIVPVPYTNDRFLTDEFYSNLEAKVKEVAEAKAQETGGEVLPVIYVGHAAIKDTDFSGHQKMNDRFIGGIECTGIDEIGAYYDYIALGHIHKAHTFCNGKARYSGTPLAMSFDEVRDDYEHGFDVVEIDAHGSAPKISPVPVATSRPLINIPALGHAEWKDAITELKTVPADFPGFIRLNVLLKGNDLLPTNKDAHIQSAMEGKNGKFAVINPLREVVKSEEEDSQIVNLTMEELQNIDHKVILNEYAKNMGFEFTKEFDEMFDIVYKIVTEAKNEDQ
jgi:exonuclease SbcD